MYTNVTIIGTVTKVMPIKPITNRNGETSDIITFFIDADNRRGGFSSTVTICATAWAKLAHVVDKNVGVGSIIIVDGELSNSKFSELQTPLTCVTARQITFLQMVKPNVVQMPIKGALPTSPDISDIF